MNFMLILSTLGGAFLVSLFVLLLLMLLDYIKDKKQFRKIRKDIKKIEKQKNITHKEAVEDWISDIKSKSEKEVKNGEGERRTETTNNRAGTGGIQENRSREESTTSMQSATNIQPVSIKGSGNDDIGTIRNEDRSSENQGRDKPINRPSISRRRLRRI